ncbi:MAG: hypothetical protein U0168_25140 [Nannocystaceae bacterium]
MWNFVGIDAIEQAARAGKRRIELIREEIREYYQRHRVTRDLLELRNISLAGHLVIECARRRLESRGLHYNLDYPDSDPAFAQDTVLSKRRGSAVRRALLLRSMMRPPLNCRGGRRPPLLLSPRWSTTSVTLAEDRPRPPTPCWPRSCPARAVPDVRGALAGRRRGRAAILEAGRAASKGRDRVAVARRATTVHDGGVVLLGQARQAMVRRRRVAGRSASEHAGRGDRASSPRLRRPSSAARRFSPTSWPHARSSPRASTRSRPHCRCPARSSSAKISPARSCATSPSGC